MYFDERHHTQKLFGTKDFQACFSSVLTFCMYICILVFFHVDGQHQTNAVFQRLSRLSFSCKKRMSEKEKENSTAGLISSFSSVWLPDICWPFQPSQRHPSSASLHHPQLLFPAFSKEKTSGFICLCSLQFQSVEIRVVHKTAWSREKGREREREKEREMMGKRENEWARRQR